MRTDDVTLTVGVPRGALHLEAAVPSHISQHNAAASLGLKSGRAFLALLPAFEAGGGDIARVGRTRIVEREAFIAFLFARDRQSVGGDDVEALADELGLKLVGGRA